MSEFDYQHVSRRTLRLDTLIRLRWLAIFGQLAAVMVVKFGLDFELPLWICLGIIALYAIFTILVRVRLGGQFRLAADRAGWLLAVDIAVLALLLGLTGGLQNPFSFLLLGPVLISATALPARMAMKLAALATICATLLVFVHLQLPWASEDPLDLPPIYMVGVWLSILLAIGYISVYAWQITEEARQLTDALAATELVLAREQHLSQLDGLAAAAAHELGTPLSTIAVVSKDLLLALADSPHAEDARILREQAQRCREILGKLTELPAPGEAFERMSLSTLIEDVIAPYRNFGVTIAVDWPAQTGEPEVARNPAIMYGLGNLLENAVDFAQKRVDVAVAWSDDQGLRDDSRRRAGLRKRNHGPHRRTLCARAQASPNTRSRRRNRPGAWLFYRQNAAGALRRARYPLQRHGTRPWRNRHSALGTQRFRAPDISRPRTWP